MPGHLGPAAAPPEVLHGAVADEASALLSRLRPPLVDPPCLSNAFLFARGVLTVGINEFVTLGPVGNELLLAEAGVWPATMPTWSCVRRAVCDARHPTPSTGPPGERVRPTACAVSPSKDGRRQANWRQWSEGVGG